MKHLVLCMALSCSALAGEKTLHTPWSGSISAGYDSLYMFRGVNQLPGYAGYGSGISWTGLSLAWAPTETDIFSATTWMAFGLNDSNYKEMDLTLSYTRVWGDLSISAAYALYAVLSEALYSNELNVSAAYDIRLGRVTVTPGVSYYYTLGPPPGQGGYINVGTGYLEFRVDASIPVYGEVVTAELWVAAGLNFGYNSTGTDEELETFDGADHFELGLTLPWALNEMVTVAPYVAYSHAWRPLPGTRRETFWGGAAVTFSF